MSELQKHWIERCGGVVTCFYRANEVDAARATDQATIAELQERLARSEAALRTGTASMYAQKHSLAVTEQWMQGWNAHMDAIDAALAAQSSANAGHSPKQQQGRTPEQYAIEHGRYLANAAGLFMESCNAVVSAEQELDKAEPDTQEEVDDLMAKTESAQEIRGERFRALEKAIYEFTKRADRAYPMAQPKQQDNAEHRCGVRGFADSGDECPGCKRDGGEA